MLQKELTEKHILEQLNPVISIFVENVIPGQVELLANNRYVENYAWMYSFEKRLKYRIEDLLGRKFSFDQEKILFGAGGAVSEGLSNAFAHGHKKDRDMPITVWVTVSHRGLGFSITDCGAGFDIDTVLSSYKKGGSFYTVAENGFPLLYRSKDIVASYQKHGTQLCLLYRIFCS